MAKFPALPLFTDAYIADTRHLTTTQHGMYLLMLITAWRTPDSSLPDDDVFLSRVVGLPLAQWLKHKPVITAFWHIDSEKKWRQRRLSDEKLFAERVRNKNSHAGVISALKRKNRDSTTVQPNVNETSTPSPLPSPLPLSISPSIGSGIQENKFLDRKRVPLDAPVGWIATCMEEMGWPQNVAQDVWIKFSGHQKRKVGHAGMKSAVEWGAEWRTWYRKENIKPKGNSHGDSKQSNQTNNPTKYERARKAVLKAAIEGGYASKPE